MTSDHLVGLAIIAAASIGLFLLKWGPRIIKSIRKNANGHRERLLTTLAYTFWTMLVICAINTAIDHKMKNMALWVATPFVFLASVVFFVRESDPHKSSDPFEPQKGEPTDYRSGPH